MIQLFPEIRLRLSLLLGVEKISGLEKQKNNDER